MFNTGKEIGFIEISLHKNIPDKNVSRETFYPEYFYLDDVLYIVLNGENAISQTRSF